MIAFNEALDASATYTISLLINDVDNDTIYGSNQLVLTVGLWPWEYWGVGTVRDDWFTSVYNVGNTEYAANFYKHKTQEGIYMIEEMYGWNFLTEAFGGTQAEIEAQLVTYRPTNITINCEDPEAVFFPLQKTGIIDNDSAYGEYEIATLQSGVGTLVDGVITFPQNGLMLQCAAGQAYANVNGMYRILLPGVEILDYSISPVLDYTKIDAESGVASAVFNMTYGADVTRISFEFAAGDITADPSAVVEAIANRKADDAADYADKQTDELAPGGGTVAIEAALETGLYTLVALPHDSEGNAVAKEASVLRFYFAGGGSQELPEVVANAKLFTVPEIGEAIGVEDMDAFLASYPEEYSVGYAITGQELESLSVYVDTAEYIDYIFSEGLEADMMAAVGADISEWAIPEIAESGAAVNISSNLEPGVSYRLVVAATNIYGNKIVFATEALTTKSITYNGELVVGEYTMSCENEASDGSTYLDECVFTLEPTNGSETNFLVRRLGIDMGSQNAIFNAVYDAAAGTLTLDGSSRNYYDRESGTYPALWNMVMGSLAIQGQGYYWGYTNAAKDYAMGAEPLVFSVDKSTKQIKSIGTYFMIFVTPDMEQVLPLYYYKPHSTITYGAASAQAMSVKAPKLNNSFRSTAVKGGLTNNIGKQLIQNSNVISVDAECKFVEPRKTQVRRAETKFRK